MYHTPFQGSHCTVYSDTHLTIYNFRLNCITLQYLVFHTTKESLSYLFNKQYSTAKGNPPTQKIKTAKQSLHHHANYPWKPTFNIHKDIFIHILFIWTFWSTWLVVSNCSVDHRNHDEDAKNCSVDHRNHDEDAKKWGMDAESEVKTIFSVAL